MSSRRSKDIWSQANTDKLGKLIARDTLVLRTRGLHHLLHSRRGANDWGPLQQARNHPASRLLRHYKRHGAPVTLADAPWSQAELEASIQRGPHRSAYEYMEFLREDMADYVDKGMWIVLPYEDVRHTPGLRLSPIGVVPQRARRPRPIVDYTFYGTNDATQPNAPMEAMQFGRALDRLLRKILLANPARGRVYLIKIDLKDGFYRIDLGLSGTPSLGVVFPSAPGEPPLVALPLRLPMGWKNSPPLFSAATETIADITNQAVLHHQQAAPHPMDYHAATRPPAQVPPPAAPDPSITVPIPHSPDPHLNPSRRRRLACVEVYVDDFIGAAQGNKRARNNVRRLLMHAIDDVFRPLEPGDPPARQEPISVKKLRLGDAAWSTQKEVLGWLIDTTSMTLRLPPCRQDRLHSILNQDVPRHRNRITVQDYHHLLGELRSMALALPGARGLFSALQEALRHTTPDARIRLTPTIHSILDDFRALHRDMPRRPTRIQELVPLPPTIHGCHDAAGHGAGGVLLPTPTAIARQVRVRVPPAARQRAQCSIAPIVWRMPFPSDVTARLSTYTNPHGELTNTDLELVGSILQSEAAVQCYDMRERTHLQRTDNIGTMFWQRKGSTTMVKPAASLLRYQAFHQRFHRHVTLHDYLAGPLNTAADDTSRLQHLSNAAFLHHFNHHYPQKHSWHLWTPPPELRSWLIGVLRNTQSVSALPLHVPAPPIPTGASGPTSAPNWPSVHFSKGLMTPLSSSKSSSTVSAPAQSHRVAIPSALVPLKMPYGRLAKRSLRWGPRIHASHPKAAWISALPTKSIITRNRIRPRTESSPSL